MNTPVWVALPTEEFIPDGQYFVKLCGEDEVIYGGWIERFMGAWVVEDEEIEVVSFLKEDSDSEPSHEVVKIAFDYANNVAFPVLRSMVMISRGEMAAKLAKAFIEGASVRYDKELILEAADFYWRYLCSELVKPDLGDIQRKNYENLKEKLYAFIILNK